MLPEIQNQILKTLVEITPVRKQNQFFCTGVRIHRNWILTAAHGVDQVDHLLVKSAVGQYAGENRFVGVTDIYVHDRYYDDLSFHDLALIRLADSSQPAFGALDGQHIHDHTNLNPKGYRLGMSLKGNTPELVQSPIDWINFRMNFDPIAKSAYDKKNLDMILYKNESTQVGHSGGPVFVMNGDEPQLIAIHSGTKGGPSGADYGYAAAIYSHLDWIRKITSVPKHKDHYVPQHAR